MGRDAILSTGRWESYITVDNYNIQPFLFRASSDSPSRSSHLVSIVTQLSVERLNSLVKMAEAWQAPISAAIYVFSHQNANDVIEKIDHVRSNSASFRKYVHVHLVSILHSVYTSLTYELPYPINLLRNIAWNYTRTEWVFILDADFTPSTQCNSDIIKLLTRFNNNNNYDNHDKKNNHNDNNNNPYDNVYVIPAYEVDKSESILPSTKDQLFQLIRMHTARPNAIKSWKYAYGMYCVVCDVGLHFRSI